MIFNIVMIYLNVIMTNVIVHLVMYVILTISNILSCDYIFRIAK